MTAPVRPGRRRSSSERSRGRRGQDRCYSRFALRAGGPGNHTDSSLDAIHEPPSTRSLRTVRSGLPRFVDGARCDGPPHEYHRTPEEPELPTFRFRATPSSWPGTGVRGSPRTVGLPPSEELWMRRSPSRTVRVYSCSTCPRCRAPAGCLQKWIRSDVGGASRTIASSDRGERTVRQSRAHRLPMAQGPTSRCVAAGLNSSTARFALDASPSKGSDPEWSWFMRASRRSSRMASR